jgi:hypothetical protein
MRLKLFLDKAWATWSWIAFVPMLVCSVIRVVTRERFDDGKLKTYFLDEVFRVFLFPGLLYYSVDLVMNFLEWEPGNHCAIGYIFHHVVTLAGAHSTLTMDYYPYFMMIPFTSHNLLLMMPQYGIFSAVYIACISLWFYCFWDGPWKRIWKYQWNFGISVSLVCGPLLTLWMLGCSNVIRE